MADTGHSMLDDNLFFLSGALSRKLSKEADDLFASIGLSTSHALILLLVDKEPDIQPSSLAEKMYLKPSTITRLVEKLEQRGLVRRESQGRVTSIACTSEGADMASEIAQKWQGLLDQKREQLGERYVDVLSEMIANALDAISEE
jgi:DNA-binding MarR family transcriptional regulator